MFPWILETDLSNVLDMERSPSSVERMICVSVSASSALKGTAFSLSLTRVIDFRAISDATEMCSLLPTTFCASLKLTFRFSHNPISSFILKIRCTDSSIRHSGSRPLFTASSTDSMARSTSSGRSTISVPASIARMAASPAQCESVMPPISRASVTIMPSKPSSFRSKSPLSSDVMVAGRSLFEIDGTAMWPTIIIPTPDSTAALNGARSTRSKSPRSAVMTGSEVCESVAVLPWPGKCLAVATILFSCTPRIKARPNLSTISGVSP